MPISIPGEVLPVLESLGIVDPANSRWQRAEPWPLRRVRAHVYCECRKQAANEVPPGTALYATRVELTFTWLANRRVFIGQCPHCQTISWRDAISEG